MEQRQKDNIMVSRRANFVYSFFIFLYD